METRVERFDSSAPPISALLAQRLTSPFNARRCYPRTNCWAFMTISANYLSKYIASLSPSFCEFYFMPILCRGPLCRGQLTLSGVAVEKGLLGSGGW